MVEKAEKQVVIVEEDDISAVLGAILETMNGIQDKMDALHDVMSEIVEKLDNLGLPGSGFFEEFES